MRSEGWAWRLPAFARRTNARKQVNEIMLLRNMVLWLIKRLSFTGLMNKSLF